MDPVTLFPTAYDDPADLADIEAVPLAERGLPATTYDVLARAAELWPDRTALVVLPDAERWEEPVRRTYGELLADVHRVANLLRSKGIRRTDAVALLAPNCDQLVTATLAAELAGIAAPINAALSAEHVRHLLDLSGARVLVAAGPDLDATIWAHAQELLAAGAVETVLRLDPTGAPSPDGLTAAAAACPADRFEGERPVADDIASLFHTGGTTGAPKLAAHTHHNEVVDAWSVAANSALAEDAAIFAALPLFHVNALVVTLLAPMFHGQHGVWAGPLGYRDPALYGCFWRLVERYGVTAMSAVPTVYAVLTMVPVDADISGLRFAVVGASMLPPGVRRGFEEHTGVPLVEGYGLTEATCASARSFAGHPRPGAVGQRFPYQQMKAVRVADDGAWVDLPAGSVGTVAIHGPAVFPGYITGRADDGTFVLDGLGKLRDGWLDTGDLGFVDGDGFLHLTGRAKDLIIRGGHNIDPALVEDALLAHPAVTGANAVGMPDRHSGEVPVAYVTVSADVAEDDLLAWAREHVTESAAAPRAVHVVDALPLTSVGKPFKLPLRADAARRAVAEALDGLAGVADVRAEVVDGGVVVTVAADAGADEAAVAAALDAFALTWRVER
ncbi:acyl-CoA synthetase [Nocardioides mangrovi]|uniref:Acyl-CoA synthetase n=1 Tax=Nocardioides mangrovi TaxID=2874580 RepID=A0ABS7UEM4_9ACTN|nr:acyl-CoA synthetase [Nocardioides mangrovi]MBZ5739146.1 acyl-CoA synthetase [Nocardioides mangrovi]